MFLIGQNLKTIFDQSEGNQIHGREVMLIDHVTSSLTCNNSSGDRAMVMQSWLRAAIKMSDASPSSTDNGHPERAQTFGLGQTNWDENCLGIFGRFISTHFGTVGSFSMFSINQLLFRQKTKPLHPNPRNSFGSGS